MVNHAWNKSGFFCQQFCSSELRLYKWVKLNFNIQMEKRKWKLKVIKIKNSHENIEQHSKGATFCSITIWPISKIITRSLNQVSYKQCCHSTSHTETECYVRPLLIECGVKKQSQQTLKHNCKNMIIQCSRPFLLISITREIAISEIIRQRNSFSQWQILLIVTKAIETVIVSVQHRYCCLFMEVSLFLSTTSIMLLLWPL